MNEIKYTEAMNLTSYSDSMQTIAHDDVDNTLHVVWQSNPHKVYSYYGLESTYNNIVNRIRGNVGTASVRNIIKDTTDSLQRAHVTEPAKLVKREVVTMASISSLKVEPVNSENTEKFVVTLRVDAEYEFELMGKDFNDAADAAKKLFSQYVTSGGAAVVGVRKA